MISFAFLSVEPILMRTTWNEEREEDVEMEEDDEGDEGQPSEAKKRRVEVQGLMGNFDRLREPHPFLTASNVVENMLCKTATKHQPAALWMPSTSSGPPWKNISNLRLLKDHRHRRRPLEERINTQRT